MTRGSSELAQARSRPPLTSTRAAPTVLALLTFGAACVGSSAELSSYTPPATRSGDEGWELFVDPPSYDRDAVAGIAPGAATPEASVVHFYASRVRGDQRFREILPQERSRRLERGLEEYEDWSFSGFRLVGRKATSPDTCWVRIWFEIEVDGDTDDGTDEVTLQRVDGRWLIEEVPT